MPDINFLILCDSAFFSDSNKLNIIGAFTYINATAIPAVHPQFTIVARAMASVGTHSISIVIKHAETGLEVARLNENFVIQEGTSEYTDIVANFVAISLPNWGKYDIVAEVNEGGRTVTKTAYFSLKNVSR